MPYLDPEKQREAQHKSYLKHKDEVYVRARADLQRKKDYLRKIKSEPCIDCGEAFPYYVMDLDHKEGEIKIQSVGSIIKHKGWEVFKKEIEKCDLVCANCHRKRTFKRDQYYNQGVFATAYVANLGAIE